jgi:hypothetical protein
LSKKYDLLFDDANISAMAATPEGRAAFDRAVQQLQQETKAYENIYAATFGDPNKADGTGMTYADYDVRLKKGGGSSAFFQNQGYQIDRTDEDFNEQLIALDNSADILSKTITFDPSTGTWGGYDVNDPLLSIDMQDARNYFAYTASQAVFNEPSSAVSTAGVYDAMSKFSSEEAMFADAKTRASVRPLDAVAYWQKTKGGPEDKKKTVQQLYAEMKTDLNVAIDAYAEAMVDEVNARKKREEAEKKRAASSGGGGGGGGDKGSNVTFSALPDGSTGFQIDGVKGQLVISGQNTTPQGIVSKDNKVFFQYTVGQNQEIKYFQLDNTNISGFEEYIPGITAKYLELSGSSKPNDEVPTQDQIDKLVKGYPQLESLIRRKGITKVEIVDAAPEGQKALLRRVLQMDGESTGGYKWDQ